MAYQNALQSTICARPIGYHYPKSTHLEPFAGLLGFFALIFLGHLHPVTFNVELQNHTVMYQAINSSCSIHRIFKKIRCHLENGKLLVIIRLPRS